MLRTKSSGRAYLPYLILLERDLSWSRRSFRELRILFLASRQEMFLTGCSGEVSRSLVHLSFQIRNAHSDIIIRKRAIIIVRSRPGGQVMFFLLHRSLVIDHITSLWLASQLKRICCIVSAVSQLAQRLLSLRLAILDQ